MHTRPQTANGQPGLTIGVRGLGGGPAVRRPLRLIVRLAVNLFDVCCFYEMQEI